MRISDWISDVCSSDLIGVTGFEVADGALWHLLDAPVEMQGTVEAVVNPLFRQMMRESHTATHILNALVFQSFDGALVTGAQMNDDGTARIAFDLQIGRASCRERVCKSVEI